MKLVGIKDCIGVKSRYVCCRAAPNKGHSVGIVGAGSVGAAIASSIIHKNIVSTIRMTDTNKELCKGIVYDLEDEAFITGTNVHANDISHMKHCDIIIVSAGARQKPNEPRTNLIKRNADILRSILTSMFPLKPTTIVIIVSNPVDVLTGLAQKMCEPYIPCTQVIGSGTYLDTQRFRVALSKLMGISVKSIHAYVVGEHGDSQVVARSASTIGGCTLDQLYRFDDGEFEHIELSVRKKAYEIIQRTGSTSHGIGSCVASIVDNILQDKNEIMPISVLHPEFETYLGWPCIIGANGVVGTIKIPLSTSEMTKLKASSNLLKDISRTL
jgi:L-lactate dehydrogenase